jgi:hypothetical protein
MLDLDDLVFAQGTRTRPIMTLVWRSGFDGGSIETGRFNIVSFEDDKKAIHYCTP